MMVHLPWVLCGVFFIVICISCYYNYKFAKIIIMMEDEIGDCLDILDDKYRSLSKVLEIPIFFDSPQVRKVIEDIKTARGSLLQIANKLSSIDEEDRSDGQSEKSN